MNCVTLNLPLGKSNWPGKGQRCLQQTQGPQGTLMVKTEILLIYSFESMLEYNQKIQTAKSEVLALILRLITTNSSSQIFWK